MDSLPKNSLTKFAVRTDFRGTGDTKGFNAMLYYSATVVLEGTHDLFPRIFQALEQLRHSG